MVGDTSPAVEAVVSGASDDYNPSSQCAKKLGEGFVMPTSSGSSSLSVCLSLMLQVECNSRLNPTKTTLLKVMLLHCTF